MKTLRLLAIVTAFSGVVVPSSVAGTEEYTNYIRQKLLPTGLIWDMPVPSEGSALSPLALDADGSRFELWTVKSGSPPVSYLLDDAYVGTYTAQGSVDITTEDLEVDAPRTRADRPFDVTITVDGLQSDPLAPIGSRYLKLVRHVQSYGTKGTGADIDRSQATMVSQSLIESNGTRQLSFPVTSIPGADRAKIRGEERFSLYTVDTNEKVASETVRIWPVADGTIDGVTPHQKFRFKMPPLTVTLNDLYPESNTYLQVYYGYPRDGVEGTLVPGSSLVVRQEVPEDRVLLIDDYDAVFDQDGVWTMELLTATPFGIDRLAYLAVEIDRTIEIKATVSTIE